MAAHDRMKQLYLWKPCYGDKDSQEVISACRSKPGLCPPRNFAMDLSDTVLGLDNIGRPVGPDWYGYDRCAISKHVERIHFWGLTVKT